MKHLIAITVLACTLIMAGGCRHHQTAATNDPKPARQQSQPKVQAVKPVNPNNVLLNIKKGMTPEEVRNIVGNPQRHTIYETGKRWVPFYYGTDFQRMDWFYGDFGHITFSINKFTNQKLVLQVHAK